MACISLVLDVVAAGTSCYQSLPVVTGSEWRMGMYKHSQSLFDLLYKLAVPRGRAEFHGEYGLYHLLDLSCNMILYRVSHVNYDVEFSMPKFLLSRKFFICESFFVKKWSFYYEKKFY